MPEMTVPEKVVEYIACSSAALEKAAAAINHQDRVKQAVAAKIPEVVSVLVEDERITPGQREKLAEALTNPVAALDLLIKVSRHRNAQELGQLGAPVGGQMKTAGASGSDPAASLTNPHVGARTTMVKQSDVNFFRRLGLAVPTA
jgi:hypothetical protein